MDAEQLIPLLPYAGIAVAALLAILFLVLWLRARHRATRLMAERADAERARIDRELELAEAGGRLRIIRELHELSVHSVSGIIAQADGARYAAAADPAVAARTAGQVADSARTVLADLRRVMTIVRDGEALAGPQPSLASTRELFRVMRDAGLDVRFEESGDRLELRHGAEVSVYRILQEALSNALAHGGPGTRVAVRFRWTESSLEILVEDDGVRARAQRAEAAGYSQQDDLAALTQRPTGRGITDMRERAELFGGVFDAFQVPGVGFTVSAVFPALHRAHGIEPQSR